ncbi:hypothetical protein [Pectobacterium phage PcaP1EGY]
MPQGESNADVYASFGVNSAVLTGSSPTEHEQNMLALDVSARDGDDAIVLDTTTNDDPYGADFDKFANPDALDDGKGFVQVRINSEGEQVELEGSAEGTQGEGTEGTAVEFAPLGETPQELTSASEQLSQHEQGFQAMIAQAVAHGLPQDSISRIQGEYESDGISDQSYTELEAAGYTRAFVDSYIAGQEGLVNSYVNQVVAFAGGQDKFSAIHAHLIATNPEAAQTFETALGNRDMGMLKAIINLAGQSYTAKFGKPAQRSVTNRAIPAAPEAKAKVEGFSSQSEMIKAMSDSRYRTDAKFRSEVEQKVINSTF